MTKKLFFLLVFTVLATALFAQNPTLPDNAAGTATQKLLDALNDPETNLETYAKENFSPSFLQQFPLKMHVDVLGMIRADYAPMQAVLIEAQNEFEMTVVVADVDKNELKIVLVASKEDTTKIDLLGMQPQKRKTEADPVKNPEEASGYLKELAGKDLFSGRVLLEVNGDIGLNESYGLANREAQVKVSDDTAFNIASIGKIFTTVAIMQLVEKGTIELEAPIQNYTDIFPENISSRVTVGHLLQHTSGWGHYWEHPYFKENSDQLKTVGDYMAFIKTIPLQGEPGEKFIYSNIGFEVLGHIIEKVSGEDFYTYIQANIFDASGMQNTGYKSKDQLTEDVAIGYATPDKTNNRDFLPFKGTPAGGVYSNTQDLLNFTRAFRAGKLIKRSSVDFIYSDIFNIREERSLLKIGGGAPGVNAVLAIDKDNPSSAIILSNLDPPVAEEIMNKLQPLIQAKN